MNRTSRPLRTAGLCLLLGLLLGACAKEPRGPVAEQTAVERHGQLRVQGNRVVDHHGEPVVLRGMSLFWSQWMPQFYNAEAVRWLKQDWNANLVRVAVGIPSADSLPDLEVEMARAEAVIDAAIAEGMYVIVDWHSHYPHPEAAAGFLARIAQKYGDRPNVIYEPWNEPLREHRWAAVVKPYHEAVIPAIRAHDPDNLIIAGTPSWSQDVDEAAADPLPFRNVAYTLHFYTGTHREELREKARRALASGAALMVTEWGASEANGDGNLDEAETRRWLDFMEEHQLSWAAWSVSDKDETSAALRPGAAGSGGWPDDMLNPSGRLLRAELRARNP